MKISFACLVLAISIGSHSLLHAQSSRAPRIEWQATLGGEASDWATKVIETPDGSILVGGVSASPPGTNKTSPLLDSTYLPANPETYVYVFGGDVWVVKLDQSGRKQWDRSFGTPADDSITGMVLGTDESIWISGRGFHGEVIPLPIEAEPHTNVARFIGRKEEFLGRMDPDGQASWQFFPGGDGTEFLFDLLPTEGDGMLIFGASDSLPGNDKMSPHYGESDGWIAQIGADGELQRDWSFGGSAGDSFFGARRTSDGGMIILGDSYSGNDGTRTATSFGFSDLWVLRLDASGGVLWERSLGGVGYEKSYGGGIVAETADGGFLIIGSSGSPPSGNKTSPSLDSDDDFADPYFRNDMWILRLNRQGDIEWDQTVGTPRDDWAQSAQVTADGGVLIRSYDPGFFFWPPILTQLFTKLSPSGTQAWQLEFTKPADGRLQFATTLPMADGGAVLALPSSCLPSDGASGSTQHFGGEDIWLIRVDANGRRLWEKTLGGNNMEYLSSLTRARDGGFIVAMSSDSAVAGANGNKTHPGYGSLDMWIVKLGPELPPDSDADGVPDELDQCPNTPHDAIVNASGCSIGQLAPCDGSWKSRRQYLITVARLATQFRKAGLISHKQGVRVFLNAVKSHCGKPRPKRISPMKNRSKS